MRVLTDYDHYAKFIPDLRVSRVIAREGNTLTVEQSGETAIWLFKMPVHVTFEVNEMPPNSLQSRTVAGNVRVLASSYALAPIASGVRLDYAGQIVPGFELVGHVVQARRRSHDAGIAFSQPASSRERDGTRHVHANPSKSQINRCRGMR